MISLYFGQRAVRLCLFSIAVSISYSAANERLTREALIARRDAAQEHSLRLQPQEPVESQAHPSQASILDRSIVLTGRGHWTFVPTGSVFVVPENFQDRVNQAEGRGRYIPFADFAAKNRGWLSTYAVTLEQARGHDPISDAARDAMTESGRVVVTVCRGGPISTRPPKVPETTAKN